MSSCRLLRDARVRPELFRWNGPVGPARLRAWLRQNGLEHRCPLDLVAFWEETGGGDVFESETILGPFGEPEMGDEVVTTNRAMHAGGMPLQFLVFHTDLLISAVDMSAGDYVALSPSDFRVLQRFSSFDDWYATTLRTEYAARYGLV